MEEKNWSNFLQGLRWSRLKRSERTRSIVERLSHAAICILISTVERFHGQYREIYRAAVRDDILRVGAGGSRAHPWRGPDVTPYVWPPLHERGTRTVANGAEMGPETLVP